MRPVQNPISSNRKGIYLTEYFQRRERTPTARGRTKAPSIAYYVKANLVTVPYLVDASFDMRVRSTKM